MSNTTPETEAPAEELETVNTAEGNEAKPVEKSMEGFDIVQLIIDTGTKQIIKVDRMFDESRLTEGHTPENINEEAFLHFETEDELKAYLTAEDCQLSKSPVLAGIMRDVTVTAKAGKDAQGNDPRVIRSLIQYYIFKDGKVFDSVFNYIGEDHTIIINSETFEVVVKALPGTDIEAVKELLQPKFELNHPTAALVSLKPVESSIPDNENDKLTDTPDVEEFVD